MSSSSGTGSAGRLGATRGEQETVANNDPLSRYIEAALGLTEVTRKRAEKLVKSLTQQGLQASGNVQELVDDLLERSQENRQAIVSLVRGESKRIVKSMGLATRSEVERLQRQVTDLRRSRSSGATQTASAAMGPTRQERPSDAQEAARSTAASVTAEKAGGGTKKATREAAKRTTKKAAQSAAKEAAKRTAARKTAEKAGDRPTRKASKQTSKKATKETSKEATKKATKKKKTTKKATKKTSKKATKRTSS